MTHHILSERRPSVSNISNKTFGDNKKVCGYRHALTCAVRRFYCRVQQRTSKFRKVLGDRVTSRALFGSARQRSGQSGLQTRRSMRTIGKCLPHNSLFFLARARFQIEPTLRVLHIRQSQLLELCQSFEVVKEPAERKARVLSFAHLEHAKFHAI